MSTTMLGYKGHGLLQSHGTYRLKSPEKKYRDMILGAVGVPKELVGHPGPPNVACVMCSKEACPKCKRKDGHDHWCPHRG
jgi:hypothetical protein